MIYYSLVYSRLQYEMFVWGTANKISLNALKINQNKILMIMLSSDIYTAAYGLHHAHDFLNLDNIY